MIKEYAIPILLGAGVIGCVITGFVAYDAGQDSTKLEYESKIAQRNKEHSEEKARLAEESARQADANAQAMASMAKIHLEQRKNDQAKSDATLAAYRSDNLRLQERFRNRPAPACNGTTTSSGSGSGNGEESVGLRDEDVQFLIRFADDADATADALRLCQGAVTSYQDLYRKTWPDAARAILDGPK